MSIQSNACLPGYNPETYKEFIHTVTKEWNLPANYLVNAESYFLQHLTAHQISDILDCDGITISTKNHEALTFLTLFNKRAITAYNEELVKEHPTQKFWLSFRAIRYPLGTTERVEGRYASNLKAYVLIQLDTSRK